MGKKKSKINVYVDYEHWYYSYKNKLKMEPNLEEWYQEIEVTYCVNKIMFFGDFGTNAMRSQLSKIKTITSSIINTASSGAGTKKDYTDFFILDAIYRDAVKRKGTDIYVIFTGDGHFELVIQYLKELGKQVVVYGVKRCFSEKLKSSASSYVEMPRRIQEQHIYYDLIFKYLKGLKLKGVRGTYSNTIKKVAECSEITEERIQFAIDELLRKDYITEQKEIYNGRKCNLLIVNWYEAIKSGVCREI